MTIEAFALTDLSDDTLLTAEQAASALTVKPATLEKWRRLGTGPVYVKLGRAVRYRAGAIRDHIAASVATSTAAVHARRLESR